MWQRKQTIYLVVAALMALATWLFPVVSYEHAGDQFIFRTTGFFNAEGTEVVDVDLKLPFSVLLTVIGVALLGCILLYKNRPRQMRFVRGTYIVTLAVIAFLFITDNSLQSYLGRNGGLVSGTYGAGFYLPLGTLILSFLAERAIRADEALVRSTERLR
ncbi:MAG TPA: DUF4293 domain-containing protein [Flavobacteriales bacterium]|nr:DUF4293 domain-containing protein [Flavobacteriales bacterium]HNU56150.1 DUF4293 domain-containing protein [Flavobacteriales bacterium]